jgi:glutathione S-transferase
MGVMRVTIKGCIFMNEGSFRHLIHHPLCPFSRKIRMIMAEKELEVTLVEEMFWLKREKFLYLSPSGRLPVLVESDGCTLIREAYPITEYLEEMHPDRPLLPRGLAERAEVRRLCEWFDFKFYQDIFPLMNERIWKRLSREGTPDSQSIRKGLEAVRQHLLMIARMTENGDWLAGSYITLADLTAAAHLSIVDFVGDIPWTDPNFAPHIEAAHLWYARIKSRRSFRVLLGDSVAPFTPPAYYSNPDF